VCADRHPSRLQSARLWGGFGRLWSWRRRRHERERDRERREGRCAAPLPPLFFPPCCSTALPPSTHTHTHSLQLARHTRPLHHTLPQSCPLVRQRPPKHAHALKTPPLPRGRERANKAPHPPPIAPTMLNSKAAGASGAAAAGALPLSGRANSREGRVVVVVSGRRAARPGQKSLPVCPPRTRALVARNPGDAPA
jgi:hypothetical protein